jgi:sterol desaturase/sphingolipid hydroxylase (fatty acid hydroxylase superfamily)
MHRSLLRIAYVPLMLAVGNGIAIAWVARGLPLAGLLPLLLIAILASFGAERLAPYDVQDRRAHGDTGRDLLHATVNEALTACVVMSIPLLSGLSPFHGLWPAHWPLFGQWLLAVAVADAGLTWVHWASHHNRWLWKFHAVHHSVQRLYGLNGLMKHPIHQLVETAVAVAPLLLLGMPQPVGALLGFSVALQLLLQHANVDVRLGPLRHVLAVGPVHRHHHQKWAGIGDVNFGLFTTVWDRLLGTLVDDPGRRFRSTDYGIGTRPDYPKAYGAQLIEPFRRRG